MDSGFSHGPTSGTTCPGCHARVFASTECLDGLAGRRRSTDRGAPGLSMLTLRVSMAPSPSCKRLDARKATLVADRHQVRPGRAIPTRRASEGSFMTTEALPSLARRVGIGAVHGAARDGRAICCRWRSARSLQEAELPHWLGWSQLPSGGWGSMPQVQRPGMLRRYSYGVAALHHSHAERTSLFVERNSFRSFHTGHTTRSNELKERNEFRSTTKALTGNPVLSLRSTTATRSRTRGWGRMPQGREPWACRRHSCGVATLPPQPRGVGCVTRGWGGMPQNRGPWTSRRLSCTTIPKISCLAVQIVRMGALVGSTARVAQDSRQCTDEQELDED
jgi:hypothetical protein